MTALVAVLPQRKQVRKNLIHFGQANQLTEMDELIH